MSDLLRPRLRREGDIARAAAVLRQEGCTSLSQARDCSQAQLTFPA